MPIQFQGVQAQIRALKKLKDVETIKIADGLKKCAEIVYNKSQQYVPVLTGALAESGKIEVTGSGNGAVCRVTYGGPSAPYAAIVHERPATHAPPTCFKFLERAIRESKGTMTNVLKRVMKGETVILKKVE